MHRKELYKTLPTQQLHNGSNAASFYCRLMLNIQRSERLETHSQFAFENLKLNLPQHTGCNWDIIIILLLLLYDCFFINNAWNELCKSFQRVKKKTLSPGNHISLTSWQSAAFDFSLVHIHNVRREPEGH